MLSYIMNTKYAEVVTKKIIGKLFGGAISDVDVSIYGSSRSYDVVTDMHIIGDNVINVSFTIRLDLDMPEYFAKVYYKNEIEQFLISENRKLEG